VSHENDAEMTLSERLIEEWFDRHRIEWRRIKVARAPGNRRPDYAIRVSGNRCIVEVKELTLNDDDKRIIENVRR
jgi:DNA-binding sugar fermentation-stimulating protein